MELNEQQQKRMDKLVETFQQGKEFVIHGELGLMGCLELPKGFHQTPAYDGFVYEVGSRGAFKDIFPNTNPISEIVAKAKETDKPVLVLDNSVIYEIKPEMSLAKAMFVQTVKQEKRDAFLEGWNEHQDVLKNEADEKYQKISIVNQPLWDKLMEENRLAPKMDFVPSTFSKNSENRIKALQLYARILEGKKEQDGVITPSAIEYADDMAGLSFDLKKISRNDPAMPQMRFEGLRFWADVVLAKTWKYGDELLKAEGFTDEETKAIKSHPKLPTKYTYWEALSHPTMRDIRVTTFWRGEKEEKPKVISHHKDETISQKKEHQKE
ncbi:MAG: hypothetical protein J6U64_05580 [Alphaproteobacteria bacterium]|nr:hypothetical protein [Alphaproteobacteria bacterium]